MIHRFSSRSLTGIIACASLFALVFQASFTSHAETLQEEAARDDSIYIMGPDNPLPADVAKDAQRRLKEFLPDLPEGYSVWIKMTIFGGAGGDKQLIRYPDRIIPLNPDGKADGVEYDFMDWYRIPTHTVSWKNGLRDGPEKVFVAGPKNEAVLKAEIPWVADKIEGDKKTFFADGKVQSVTPYADGEANGESKTYDAEGHVIRMATFKKGQREGLMRDFWPGTEQPKREITYADGKVNGLAKEYYANGQLKVERPFTMDVMHGVERQFEADGKPSRTRYWLNGDMVDEAAWNAAAGK